MIGLEEVMKLIEIIINLIYRMIFGVIGIYFLNQLVQFAGLGIQVGLNGWTISVAGVLGFPGVILLFAVGLVGSI